MFLFQNNHLSIKTANMSYFKIHFVCFYLLTNDPENLMHYKIISPEICTFSSSLVLSVSVWDFFLCEPEIHHAYAPPLSTLLSAIQYQTLLRASVLSL